MRKLVIKICEFLGGKFNFIITDMIEWEKGVEKTIDKVFPKRYKEHLEKIKKQKEYQNYVISLEKENIRLKKK